MARDSVYLLDILEAARLAVSYLRGVSHEAFLRDTQRQDSVIRRIEIIGEAARRVSVASRACRHWRWNDESATVAPQGRLGCVWSSAGHPAAGGFRFGVAPRFSPGQRP